MTAAIGLPRLLLRVTAVGVLVMAALAVAPDPVAAAPGDSCAERFPEVPWVDVLDGPVTVEATGLTEGLRGRYFEEISLVSGWIRDDIGPFSATVCLIENDSAFDTTRWVEGSQRFHARMEMDEQLVALNVERFGFVGPAAAWSLAHQALWQNTPLDAHPEPISSVIGQWYRARFLDRMELYYRDVMVENFFDSDFDTGAVIDWTASEQQPIVDWDPERNFQAIGTFVDFAVAEYGTEVLLETDGARWSEIEAEWRAALLTDLTGRSTPTTDWMVGAAIAAGTLFVALVAVIIGLWSKYRRRERPQTEPAIPGFFSET